MAVREGLIKTGKISEQQALIEVGTKSGEKYYFGNLLNQPLLEIQYSVWSLTAGEAQSIGCSDLPNIQEMVSYSASSLGSENFGIPRLPAGHELSDIPANYVRNFWGPIKPLLQQYCSSPFEWPMLLGLAIQETIIMGKDVLEPKLAVTVVMECALPASKYDPASLGI